MTIPFGGYDVTEIPVPDPDQEAGVLRRWKVTHRRTGTVAVVAHQKSPFGIKLLCSCGEAICAHREDVMRLLCPPTPDGGGMRAVA